MDISLTWDFVIVSSFVIATAGSYLLGKEQCITLTLATYVSLVTVQGLSAFFGRFYAEYVATLATLGIRVDLQVLVALKLVVLLLCIIALVALRGGLSLSLNRADWTPINAIMCGLLGLSTAGLLLVTTATYLAGAPLLSPTLGSSPAISGLLQTTTSLRWAVEFQDVCFVLPAVVLLAIGLYERA
jgi:hypothetical protein